MADKKKPGWPDGTVGALENGTEAYVAPFGEVLVTGRISGARLVRRLVDGKPDRNPMAVDPLSPAKVLKTAAERYAGALGGGAEVDPLKGAKCVGT